MDGRAGAALAILLLSGASASAQNYQRGPYEPRPYPTQEQPYNSGAQQGTTDEQTACTGDAVKFCSDAIPYTFRVLACLQKNRHQISVACRAVLASHGQ
jgi:hypothetical protein